MRFVQKTAACLITVNWRWPNSWQNRPIFCRDLVEARSIGSAIKSFSVGVGGASEDAPFFLRKKNFAAMHLDLDQSFRGAV